MKNATKRIAVISFLVWMSCCVLPSVAQQPGNAPASQTPKRKWGPEQATGAPDTHQAGDIVTAWASLRPDGGKEWLKVDFKKATNIAEVRIRETFNPGAISKVVAILEDGKENVLWKGQEPTTGAPAFFTVKVEDDVVSKSIKIYLDTTRKQGWNEIDAVELIGKDATRQWASHASASSTYAERANHHGTPIARVPELFPEVQQKLVFVHLEGGKTLSGAFVRTAFGFIVIKQGSKTLVINTQKILYLETVETPHRK